MSLYDTDPMLPEAMTIVLLIVGIVLFIYLSPYLSLRSASPVSPDQKTEISLELGANKTVYYISGGAVILSFCLLILGIYTFVSKIERVESRNKGLHWIIWGVAILFAVIAIQVLFFVTPILS